MRDELLIAGSLKASVILIAASVLYIALWRASAALRHLLWAVAFAALLLLPVVSPVAPGWTIARPETRLPAPPQANRLRQVSTQPAAPVRSGIDWLPLVWSIGAALVLARFGAGTARIWLRSRRAKPLAIPGGSAAILDAGSGVMPMTWGALRPVVLLPTEAADWPAERLRAVLLHELAHVARHDYLTLV